MKRRSKSVIISHAEKEIPAVVVLAHSSFFSFLFFSVVRKMFGTGHPQGYTCGFLVLSHAGDLKELVRFVFEISISAPG